MVFRNGFPETETTTLTVPGGNERSATWKRRCQRDAAGDAPTGTLGTGYRLPDGYLRGVGKAAFLTANTAYKLIFRLLDPQGKPAADMQPYSGKAWQGHAAFVKTDGTAFAHTHPDGSAAMPAVILANESLGLSMNGMAGESAMNIERGASLADGGLPLMAFRLAGSVSHLYPDEARK